MTYDIAIIGLGPAGATAARLLAEKYNVVAIDRKELHSSSRITKCCGGLLADDAQKSLAKFGLTLPKEILVDPQVFAVRTIDLDLKIERYYQRFYMNMDRHAFDLWLCSLIPKSVEIYDDALCTKITGNEGEYEISFQRNGEKKKIQAKWIIGVDGANSIVRKTFFEDRKIQQYISIQEWFDFEKQDPFYAAIFDAQTTDSYSWALCKDEHFILGSALPPDDPAMRFERLKSRIKDRSFVLEHPVKREGCFVNFLSSPSEICTGRGNVLLIGEAAGMISPSSLEGISYGMDSAYLLSEVFLKSDKRVAERYHQASGGLRRKLWRKILKAPFLNAPFFRRQIMRSGMDSIKMIHPASE